MPKRLISLRMALVIIAVALSLASSSRAQALNVGSAVGVAGTTQFLGVGCASSSTCYAVGYFSSSECSCPPFQGVVVPVTNGTTGAASVVTGAHNLSIACPSIVCYAVGDAGNFPDQGVVISIQ